MLVSADEMSKGLTVNYLSQFRKRPSMSDSGKEIQDSSFHGPFSKRPTHDHQDFKVSNPTNMPKMDVGEFDRRGNLNSESDGSNLENSVMAASGGDSENKFTTSDRYRVTLNDGIRRSECKSITNMDATVKESDKIQNITVEDLNSEKDTAIQLKQKVMEEDRGLHVSVAQVTQACVILNDSNIQCQKSETHVARTELKVCSFDESRQQQNTDESAKSDQPATRDNCESDSRQSPTSEQQKGDSSAPDDHQTKPNCDLCGKVQSSQESLQKVR
jgi:hypothetical protein